MMNHSGWKGPALGIGVLALITAFGIACRPPQPPATETGAAVVSPTRPPRGVVSPALKPKVIEPAPIQFRDVTETARISFVHCSGYDSEKHFPTSLGSGLAMFDYDGDGLMDLYFATTRNFPLDAPTRSPGNRLYRNLGDGRFEDVTSLAGVGYSGFCHGVAVADADGDGFSDIYLTNLGGNVLYLNNGDGTFRDATAGSGLECGLWCAGAAWIDYDGDGHLDLYVSCYGRWTYDGEHPFCGDESRGLRILCSPFSIAPERHFLYRSRGDGTFEETTEAAGVLRRDGRGLGVVAADVNLDGLTDLYVANDGCPNFLFLNRGKGRFEDVSEVSGAATDSSGENQGSMGVDAEDVDDDGLPELFVTNFRGQYNTLYKNIGGTNFQDVSGMAGIVKDSKLWVGWGCALADLDNDTKPDMFVVNGEVDDNLREFGQNLDFKEPAKVWRNLGGCVYRLVDDPGPFFAQNHAARGVAFGDLDDDGKIDAVVSRMDESAVLLQNASAPAHWIRLDLIGRKSNRSAIGAVVRVHVGDRVITRQVKGGGSYLSTNDPRLLIGLGGADRVDRVEVRWPAGTVDSLDSPATDRTHLVLESLRNLGAGGKP